MNVAAVAQLVRERKKEAGTDSSQGLLPYMPSHTLLCVHYFIFHCDGSHCLLSGKQSHQSVGDTVCCLSRNKEQSPPAIYRCVNFPDIRLLVIKIFAYFRDPLQWLTSTSIFLILTSQVNKVI